MGSNQVFSFTKRFTHVKVPTLDLSGLKALKQLMTPQQHQDFVGTYGKILDLAMIEVPTAAITALVQYYDPRMRCFTFQDFHLVLILWEEPSLSSPWDTLHSYLDYPKCWEF